MAYEEKSAWVMGVLAVLTYSIYITVLLSTAGGGPLTETDYVPLVFWTIGSSIVASILIHIVLGMFSPHVRRRSDQRDRQIHKFGEYVGNGFLVAGALAAMLFAMFEFGHFWIANVIYLAFTLSAILASVAKIVAYRRGLPEW